LIEYEKIESSLAELDEDSLISLINEFIESNPSVQEAEKIMKALQTGMDKIGKLFEEGEYFVGDLIYAGDILQNAVEMIKPVLGSAQEERLGKIVIGSAPGDLHDIGKNIFISMVEIAGFEVIVLGVDVSPQKFVEAVKREKPDIVGISGLLTLSLDTMKDVIDALDAAGVRSNVKVMIGGNPVNDAIQKRVGADANSNNAAIGVRICKDWMVS
jgi:methylmalonyl-CoA mutase cobalamin-binding domain/chain